jgi:hypothetical protein
VHQFCLFIRLFQVNALFLSIFIFVSLYVFRAAMGPLSGDVTVFMWHLVLVYLYGWLLGLQGGRKRSTLQTRQLMYNYFVTYSRNICFSSLEFITRDMVIVKIPPNTVDSMKTNPNSWRLYCLICVCVCWYSFFIVKYS